MVSVATSKRAAREAQSLPKETDPHQHAQASTNTAFKTRVRSKLQAFCFQDNSADEFEEKYPELEPKTGATDVLDPCSKESEIKKTAAKDEKIFQDVEVDPEGTENKNEALSESVDKVFDPIPPKSPTVEDPELSALFPVFSPTKMIPNGDIMDPGSDPVIRRRSSGVRSCRSRVKTPPPLEEVAVAIKALDEKGHISPVDIVDLVDKWEADVIQNLDQDQQRSATQTHLNGYGKVSCPVSDVKLKTRRFAETAEARISEIELASLMDSEVDIDRFAARVKLHEGTNSKISSSAVKDREVVDVKHCHPSPIHAPKGSTLALHAATPTHDPKVDSAKPSPLCADPFSLGDVLDFDDFSPEIEDEKMTDIDTGEIPWQKDKAGVSLEMKGVSKQSEKGVGVANVGASAFASPVPTKASTPVLAKTSTPVPTKTSTPVPERMAKHSVSPSDPVAPHMSFFGEDDSLQGAVVTPASCRVSDRQKSVSPKPNGKPPMDTSQITFTQALAWVHDSSDTLHREHIHDKSSGSLKSTSSHSHSRPRSRSGSTSPCPVIGGEQKLHLQQETVAKETLASPTCIKETEKPILAQKACEPATTTCLNLDSNLDAVLEVPQFDLGFDFDDFSDEDIIPPSPQRSTQPITQKTRITGAFSTSISAATGGPQCKTNLSTALEHSARKEPPLAIVKPTMTPPESTTVQQGAVQTPAAWDPNGETLELPPVAEEHEEGIMQSTQVISN